MNISQAGIDLIKHFEGCKLTAYQDSIGIWTIGYGSTFYQDGTPVKKGDIITQDKADALFHIILYKFETDIATHITQVMTQRQYDALCSLVYNIGIGGFNGSTVLKDLNKYNLSFLLDSQKTQITNDWCAWDRAGGRPILLSRRTTEVDWFLS